MTWLTFIPRFFIKLFWAPVLPLVHAAVSVTLWLTRFALESLPVLLPLDCVLIGLLAARNLWRHVNAKDSHYNPSQHGPINAHGPIAQPAQAHPAFFAANECIRTSEECFHGLEEVQWPYQPQYMEFAGLRIHYIDEVPLEAAAQGCHPQHTVVLCHGLFAWAIQYRKLIPLLLSSGCRVVALDWAGHGRSDKPLQVASKRVSTPVAQGLAWLLLPCAQGCHVTPELHMSSLRALLRELELWGVTLVLQGCLGSSCLQALHLLPQGSVARLVLLGVPCPSPGPSPAGPADWTQRLALLRSAALSCCVVSLMELLGENLPVSLVALLLVPSGLDSEAATAYGAPYPSAKHKGVTTSPPEALLLPCAELVCWLQSAWQQLGLSKGTLRWISSSGLLPPGLSLHSSTWQLTAATHTWMQQHWRQPTLLLVGQQDVFSRPLMHGWFPGWLHGSCTRYSQHPRLLMDAGYWLMEDAPGALAKELQEFVKGG